jgi:hypothetical protein
MSKSLTPLTLSEGYDSLIFKQMGLSIIQGKALYIDLFDHKGPIIFFINAIGQWIISGKLGLLLLYTINFTFVLFLWYKMSLLFVRSRIVAIFPVILALLFLQMASNEDNVTEDWSLIPITYSLYLFAKFYVKGHNITIKEFFFLGIGMGVVTFMRVNNMAPNCCVILVLAIIFILRHRLHELKKMVLYVFYGWLFVGLIVIIVILSLYGKQGFVEMMNGTFVYNFIYIGSSQAQAVAPDRMRWYVRYGLSSLFFIILLYIKYKNDLLPHVLLMCYLATFVSIGTKGWQNYFIVFSPVFALSLSALNVGLNKWVRYMITLLVIVYLGRPFCDRINSKEYDLEVFYQKSNEILDKIETDEKGKIWNNADFTGLSVLHKKGLIQVNRAVLGFHLDMFEKLKQDEINKFETIKPRYVLLSSKIENYDFLYNASRIKENYILMDQVETGGRLYVYKKYRNW